MARLLKTLFKGISPLTLWTFENACKEPFKTQQKLLNQIVQGNKDSAFGKEHGFAGIRDFDDFQERVPICTYADLEPYIQKSMNGEKSQLTSQDPTLFAITSGTTGKSKYIPMTAKSKSAKSSLMRVWLSGVFRDHPAMFDGRIFTIVSPEVEEYSAGGLPCGSESGHGYKNMPGLLKSTYSTPYDVYEIKNYEAKYYTLLRIATEQDVRLLYTCNPSTVLLVAQRMGEHTERIIQDVREGSLSDDFEIAPEIRESVLKTLKPNPARADELEVAANLGNGVLLPKHVWQGLDIICCWKGGTVGMYLERFDQYFKAGTPVRDIGYFASELRGSVPLDDSGPDGVLAVTINVCEFYPADLADKPQGTDLLRADQLEVGKRYFIYVTTHAGLYRYEMNDIVEVTGMYGNTPVIRFVQKGKGVVSFTGEKLYETQVIDSVDDALAERKGQYEFIAAIGEMQDKPTYSFLIEFDVEPSPDVANQFLIQIEQNLREHNMEYGSKRDSLRINPPKLRIIKPGEFARYRQREVSSGKKNDGQFKTLRLTTDAAFASEFEVISELTLQ